MKIPNVTIQQLLEAGVHLGHKTLRWNPKMKKYIFGKRDSIHIIDLTQTLELINVALENVYKVISENGKILFISTKKQAAEAIADPEIAPNNMAETILTRASPPGRPPTIVFAKLINRLASPPFAIILPDRMKSGIASRVKLSNPVAICWATVLIAGENPAPIIRVRVVEIPIQTAIRKFNTINVIKLIISINTSISINNILI